MLTPYLQLIRLPAVFTAISNIFAAYMVSGAGLDKLPYAVTLGLVSALVYMTGMILNDCFDLADDTLHQPFRPIPAGKVSLKSAYLLALLFTSIALLLSLYIGILQFYLTAGLVLSVVFYDFYLKNTVLRSIGMATCRYLNWLLGLSLVTIATQSLILPLPIFFYISGLTLLSTIEVGKFKLPVVNLSLAIIILSFLTIPLLIVTYHFHYSAILIALFLLYLTVRKFINVYVTRNDSSVQETVKFLIFCIIPLDATLVYAIGEWWQSLCILALLAPARWIGKRLYVT